MASWFTKAANKIGSALTGQKNYNVWHDLNKAGSAAVGGVGGLVSAIPQVVASAASGYAVGGVAGAITGACTAAAPSYFGRFNLRNRANCNFQTCKKYWSGEYDAEIAKFASSLSDNSDGDGTDDSPGIVTSPDGGLKVAGGLGILLLLGGLAWWRHKRG